MPRKYNISSRKAVLRASMGGDLRKDPNADVTEKRRELKFIGAEEYIARLVADPPALTDDQLADLASRLLPVPLKGEAAA